MHVYEQINSKDAVQISLDLKRVRTSTSVHYN